MATRNANLHLGSLLARGIACFLLALALGRMPYGYYTFLRLFLTLTLGHAAYLSARQNQTEWMWVLGVTAFIYNPVVPMHFGRDGWPIVNALTIPVIIASCFYVNRDSSNAE
jgi:hypothetical protein